MNLEITIPVLNEEETIRDKIKEMIDYTQKNILNKNGRRNFKRKF